MILGHKQVKPSYKESTNIGPKQLVYNRELEAIARATEVIAYRA